jgi:hypothetical protein
MIIGTAGKRGQKRFCDHPSSTDIEDSHGMWHDEDEALNARWNQRTERYARNAQRTHQG